MDVLQLLTYDKEMQPPVFYNRACPDYCTDTRDRCHFLKNDICDLFGKVVKDFWGFYRKHAECAHHCYHTNRLNELQFEKQIKEEPFSAEEYINKNFPNTIERVDYKRHSFFTMDDAIAIFKAGEKNERLKHKPSRTMDQYISSPSFELKNIDKERFKQGWKACLESHNLEE